MTQGSSVTGFAAFSSPWLGNEPSHGVGGGCPLVCSQGGVCREVISNRA